MHSSVPLTYVTLLIHWLLVHNTNYYKVHKIPIMIYCLVPNPNLNTCLILYAYIPATSMHLSSDYAFLKTKV